MQDQLSVVDKHINLRRLSPNLTSRLPSPHEAVSDVPAVQMSTSGKLSSALIREEGLCTFCAGFLLFGIRPRKLLTKEP
eukprot:5808551-Amphidinium_carterae.1